MFDRNPDDRKSQPPSGPRASGAPPARDLGSRILAILATLPRAVVPHRTYLQHPMVVTRLLSTWSDPRSFHARVESLLLDNRSGRQGFDFDVVREITLLRDHYERHVAPRRRDAWDEVRGH